MDNNKQWICPKCKKLNSNKFCGSCGTRKPEEKSFQSLTSVQSVTMQSTKKETSSLSSKFNKYNKKIRYILIIIIVILIGILAGIFFSNKNIPVEETSDVIVEGQISSDIDRTKENIDTEIQETEKASDVKQTKSNELISEENTNLDYLKGKVVPNKDKQKNTDISDAGVKFFEYHRAITEHNLRTAYGLLSKDFQDRMTYEGWAPGFDKTLSSNPSNLQLISSEPNRVEFSYNLEARDKENNKVKVQSFKGKTILIKENGNWKIDSIVADKIGEHIE